MEPEKVIKVLIIKESLWQSVLSDIFTFFCLFSLLYINHKLLGSSWVVEMMIILSYILYITKMMPSKVKTIYLNTHTIAKIISETEAERS